MSKEWFKKNETREGACYARRSEGSLNTAVHIDTRVLVFSHQPSLERV